MKKLIPTLTLLTLVTSSALAGFSRERGEFHSQRITKQRIELATSLVAAHGEGYICDADAYTSSVVQAIANVSSHWQSPLTKNLRAKVAANKALRENLALKYVTTGGPGETVAAVAAAMINTNLFSPGEGAYGSTFHVRFKSATEATVSRLDVSLDNPKFVDVKATWSLVEVENGYKLTLNYDGKSESFTLSKDGIYYKTHASGELRFEGTGDYPRSLTTSPSECEA